MGSTTISRSGDGSPTANSQLLSKVSIMGQDVSLSSVIATALSTERWTESGYSHTPGSVSVAGNVIHVTPPNVRTWSVARQRLWVRLDEGKETVLDIPEAVQIRQGHALELVIASGKSGSAEQHRWAAVYNRSVGTWWQIDALPPVRVHGRWVGFWYRSFSEACRSCGNPVLALFGAGVLMCPVLGVPLYWLGMFREGFNVGAALTAMLSAITTVITLAAGYSQMRGSVKQYANAIRSYIGSL